MMMKIVQHLYHAILNENFLSYVIQSIIICSLTMSFIAAFVLLISRHMKNRQSAAGRCLLWWVIGFGFLIPCKPHPAGSITVISADGLHDSPTLADMIAYRLHSRCDLSKEFFVLLFCVWLIGAVVYGTVTLNRQEQFRRDIKRLRRPADMHTQALADLLCDTLSIRRHIPVYTVPVIETPMLSGLLRHCILLPEQEYDSEELRLILKHELCHYCRDDLLCKLLWIGCRTVHWFNPFLPLLMQQMEQDCELACDEAVMENEPSDSANIYCKAILHTAMRRTAGKRTDTVLATGFSCSKEILRSRLQAILSGVRKRCCPAVAAVALILTLLTGSLLAYEVFDTMPSLAPHNTFTSAAAAPVPDPENPAEPQTTLPPPEYLTEQNIPAVEEMPDAVHTQPQIIPLP